MQRTSVAFLIALAVARPAIAQTPLSALQPGDTIRVWAVDPRLNGQSGIFDTRLRDTLRFSRLPQPPITTIAVGFPALRRIDVKRGQHRSPARIIIGTVLGAAAGAVAGSALGVLIECGRDCGDDGEWGGFAGFMLGGGFGILAGGTTGAIITARHRTARWEVVDPRR